MPQTTELLEFAVELAAAARSVVLPMFRSPLPIGNKLTAGFDPVTEADRAAEREIRRLIEARFPGHGIIGEEFGEKAAESEFTWILDPIDGTRSFISGTPTWMTLVAVTCHGKPVAGVACQPFTGEVFAGSSSGSFLLHDGNRTQLSCTRQTAIEDVLAGTTAPELFVRHGHEERLQRLQASVRHMRFDADAYFHCMVAAGHLGISLDTGLQAYDIAALVPIIEGAGGIVTTWDGASAAGGGDIIAAGNSSLYEQALKLLQ